MLSPQAINNRSVCTLTANKKTYSLPLGKLMMYCFNGDVRDRTWIIRHIDGDFKNCALDNLRWDSMKNAHKSYAMEIEQAVKIYVSESPDAAGKYLQDVVAKIVDDLN